MRDLLRLIAFQLGSEVSYDELGKQLSMSKTTVEKYLDLLEKVFVIYRLGAYSRNLRKEVTKAGKCGLIVDKPLILHDLEGNDTEEYKKLQEVINNDTEKL